MIEFGGIFLPDGEKHFVEYMGVANLTYDGKLTYQMDKQQAAMRYVKKHRCAVDIGAHVGLWSRNLELWFQEVHSFEPLASNRECLAKNIHGKAKIYPYALGSEECSVAMVEDPTCSGNAYILGEGDIPVKRLDDLNLENVDFMKLDCEGYELFALRGASETIKRCRPVICVEQKKGHGEKYGIDDKDGVRLLKSMGATLREAIHGDYILTFDQ